MLLPWEIKCNMTRTPVRSILIACVSALMVCGMTLYLRNIQATEAALDGLAQELPVTVRVTNRDGSLRSDLCIQGKDVDFLLESGVRDTSCTTVFTGDLGEGTRMTILGANTLEALDGPTPEVFTFAEGWDCSFLEGDQPVCAMEESYARKQGLRLGDELSPKLYSVDRLSGHFTTIGSHRLTLIATYQASGNWRNTFMPIGWLRAATDSATAPSGDPVGFYYDSFSAVLETPSELNAYKESIEAWGFYQRSALANPSIAGDTLSIEDEMYIKTGSEMMESLALYRVFLPPFFGLVTLIIALVTFLALRSSRRIIAIASSLGREKFLNAAAHFGSSVIVQLGGALMALLAMTLTAGLLPNLFGLTLGAFSLCAMGGTALALLFLFRFDTLTLLTKND